MKSIFHLFASKIRQENSFTLVDVGAMGGIAKKWDVLSDYMRIIAFEPDDREFQKLKNSEKVTYLNSVLHEKSQDLKFYISKDPGKSSIYKPNLDVLSNFENIERFHIVKEIDMASEKVKSLDSIMEENSIDDIDFIKLDTQGSELGILKGAQTYAVPKTFGIHIEVEFIEMYKGQPLFRDVDGFMDKNGFELIDLRRAFWKRKDYYNYVGKGQLVFGNALYFKRIDVLSQWLYDLHDKDYSVSKLYKILLICLIMQLQSPESVLSWSISLKVSMKISFRKSSISHRKGKHRTSPVNQNCISW